MRFFNSNCDWCFKLINASYYDNKQRFCSSACKMAFWRAYKKYVTHRGTVPPAAAARTVTHKKHKKRGKKRAL